MQMPQYNELNERASELFENRMHTLEQQLQAKDAVNRVAEEMVKEDKILILSDEEEQMIRQFRRFRARCKSGDVFKWQTTHDPAGVIVSADCGLIQDPRDVSE